MYSRRIKIGISVAIVALGYLFVVSPVYRLWRAEAALKPIITAARIDMAQKHEGRLLPLVGAAVGPLTTAHKALGWLTYVGWIPGIGKTYRSMAATVNSVYYISAGMWVLPLVSPHGSISPDATAFMHHVLDHWATLRHGLPAATGDFQKAEDALVAIDVKCLPVSLRPLGKDLRKAQPVLRGVVRMGPAVANHIGMWATLLGVQKPARYLILFQNSGELRASGGLITAFGTVRVKDGHLGPVSPVDTAGFNVHSTIPAPFPFQHYFGQRILSFENASANPDIPQTAQTVYALLRHDHALPAVDGIIFVNTALVDRLLALEGPLTIPSAVTNGAPVTLTASNANVEMEYVAERSGLPNATRKQFIGLVMHDLLHRAMATHATALLGLARTLGAALQNKSLVLYLNPVPAEQVMTQLGWAGNIPRHPAGDYLQVVDENLGGHKDNFFLQQSVRTALQTRGHHTIETTTITWTMPVVANGWLTVGYPGWVELYVPQGSHLLSMGGAGTVDDRAYVAQGVNKTVFAGTFYVPNKPAPSSPPEVRRMVIRYVLPATVNPHRILVQLQPGVPQQNLTVQWGNVVKSTRQTHDLTLVE